MIKRSCATETDISNNKFSNLLVIERVKNSKTKWICLCECGNKIIIDAYRLLNEKRKSCGCLQNFDLQRDFYSKIDRRDENECWPWIGKIDSMGYGTKFVFNGKSRRPHVIVCILKYGREPKRDEYALHECDNKICCNKNHIVFGSQKKNIKDSFIRKRRFYIKPEHPISAKLTKRQVLLIFKSKSNISDLADRYNISKVAIRNIKSGKSWSDLTGKKNEPRK